MPWRADVDPRARRSSGRTSSARGPRAAGTRPTSPIRARGSSWRSARAAPTRACGTRRRACPTGRAASRRPPSVAQRAHDRVERLPRARGAAGAAVDDEVLGPLGDVRVEVVHQHPQRGLLRPALAGELAAARRADRRGPFTPAPRSRPRPPPSSAPDAHQLLGGRQVGRELPVRPRARRCARAARASAAAVAGARLQRRAQVEPVRGARQLDARGCARGCASAVRSLRAARPAHRDVVLLHRARRAASRRSRARPAAGSRPPARPACTGRSSAPS